MCDALTGRDLQIAEMRFGFSGLYVTDVIRPDEDGHLDRLIEHCESSLDHLPNSIALMVHLVYGQQKLTSELVVTARVKRRLRHKKRLEHSRQEAEREKCVRIFHSNIC